MGISLGKPNIGINLTVEIKDLFFENYEALIKGIDSNTNKWKDNP